MRFYELLQETKVLFNKQDVEQAADKDELGYGVVYITLLTNGDLIIGYNMGNRGSLNITLWTKAKRIEIRGAAKGEKLLPKAQQALKELMNKGIIDNTWTLDTGHDAGMYDKENRSKYIKVNHPLDNFDWSTLIDKAIRLSPVAKDLVFYHGTSSDDWKRIQKVGLHPLGTSPNSQHGFESRGKHEGNTGVLYLAANMDKAYSYAKSRVESLNTKKHGSAYIYDLDLEPVVLRVQIPDPSKLVSDDDMIIHVAQQIARRLWKSKSDDERNVICQELSRKHGFNVKYDSGYMLWRESDKGFSQIMSKFPKRLFKSWMASLNRYDQVGYKGIIPPKFLERII